MNKINHRITLDVQKGGVQKVLRGMFAGEVLSRRIVVSLVAGSSVCSMDENTTAVMYVTKPNGVTNYGACTIEDNLVFYDVLQADVDAPGITQMQLKVLSGDMVLYAPVFSVEVQASRTSDTQATETPTYTALEQALAQATEAYNKRVDSIEIEEDLTFVVTYGDGTTYESEAIKNALANIDDAEAERVAAEHDRAESFSKMEYAEQQRADAFANMQTAVQGALDVTVNLQGEVQSLIDANGVTVEDKENWDGKADGLSYKNNKLALLNGEKVLEEVEIIAGSGGAIPKKVLVASNVTAADVEAPKINADLLGGRTPEAFALKEELTARSLPNNTLSSQSELLNFLNNYSANFADDIFYEFEVNGVEGYELNEGVWYISGTKRDSLHETQDAKRYCPDRVEIKRRSKYEGVWSDWVADVNALDLANIENGTTPFGNAKTLDGHGAEYFAPLEALEVRTPRLVITIPSTATEQEVNNVLDSLDNEYPAYSLYEVQVAWNVVHSKFSGGRFVIRGWKYSNQYGYQEISNDAWNYSYKRFKNKTWQEWDREAMLKDLSNYLPRTKFTWGDIQGYINYTASQVDCNDIKGGVILGSGTNLHFPSGDFWYVMTLNYVDYAKKQIAFSYANDSVIKVRTYRDGVWSAWGDITSDKYLSLTGGKLSTPTSNTPVTLESTTANAQQVFIEFLANGKSMGHIGVNGAYNFVVRAVKNGSASYEELLHTGNKPTFTYTGNGSDASRTINVGGIGELLYIEGDEFSVQVTKLGATVFVYGAGSVIASIPKAEMKFDSGVLTMATSNTWVNKSGVTYTGRVL